MGQEGHPIVEDRWASLLRGAQMEEGQSCVESVCVYGLSTKSKVLVQSVLEPMA
jgi:hypothetical protein